MNHKNMILATLCISVTFCGACSTYRLPYLAIQACLPSSVDKASTMRLILQDSAKKYDLLTTDYSKDSHEDFEQIKEESEIDKSINQTINIVVKKRNRILITVDDLGLSKNEVLVSFFGNIKNRNDESLSDEFIEELSKFGRVKKIPYGKGALPDQQCKS